MALIESHRHTAEDLRHWASLEAVDKALGATPRMARMEVAAVEEMRAFLADGEAYVSVSWGKDSVVVAGLAALHGLPVRLLWQRVPPVTDPDCVLVRDAFLRRFPAVQYSEVVAPLRWYPDRRAWLFVDRTRGDFTPLHRVWGDRRITGVRSQESKARTMRQAVHGVSTAKTCAPITRWRGQDVFAFLARHDLPVHPAYACSYGGMMDRVWLRVDELDSDRSKAWGGEDWERAYYRDEMLELDARRDRDLEEYATEADYWQPGMRRKVTTFND